MDREVNILFGAPGTGKTTFLINRVEHYLAKGIEPSRIAYVAFSRKAAKEAMQRAVAKVKVHEEDLVWFRTLHSAAYNLLELHKSNVMTTNDFRELGDNLGLVFRGTYDINTERIPIDVRGTGDKCLAIYAKAKARRTSIEQEWRAANFYDLPWVTVERFCSRLEKYKKDKGLLDFVDMIDQCDVTLDIDVLIVDEAQDLTMQQWAFARRLGAQSPVVYIAGDDDQAIYAWSGATAMPLLTIKGNRIVLPHSYRLPRIIKQACDKVSGRIKIREPKNFTSRDEDGSIAWMREMSDVNLSSGTWLLLARNRHHLADLVDLARTQSVVYSIDGTWSNQTDSIKAVVAYEKLRKGGTISGSEGRLVCRMIPGCKSVASDRLLMWNDFRFPFQEKPDWMKAMTMDPAEREYIRGLRRRGEKLIGPGRVTISTVHGAKGGEAQNVLLLTDISERVAAEAVKKPDDEARVLYVGMSRAEQNLYLVQPRGRNYWVV